MIKLEIIYSNNSSLLEYIRSDNSDTSYITKLIKDDIQILSDNNKELCNKVRELEKVGLGDKQFLDKELIMLLSIDDINNFTSKAKEIFLNNIDEYTNVSNELMTLNRNNKITTDEIIEIKKYNKIISLKKLLKRISFLVNMGLVSIAIAFSIKSAKNITQDTEYKTVTTTYDTSMPEKDITEEYLSSRDNSVSLTEYSPWEEPGYFRDNYKRNVYEYDLINVEFYENIEDYLNPDLKEIIAVTEYVEISDEKPTEEYSDNKYVITQVVQYKDEYRLVDDLASWKVLSALFSFGIVAGDIFLFSLLSKVKLKDLKQSKKNNKQELAEKKQLLIETKNRINELNTELFTLRNDLQQKYDTLPSLLQEDQKIKEKMLSLDNNYKN